jgi:uncharacterized membrane protein
MNKIKKKLAVNAFEILHIDKKLAAYFFEFAFVFPSNEDSIFIRSVSRKRINQVSNVHNIIFFTCD